MRLRLRSPAVVLALVLVAGCTPTGASAEPEVTPVVPATPSAAPSVSSVASDAPTGTPMPTATATSDPSALELEVTSCNGGVVLEWSPSPHPDFHHYTALRSPEAEIATQYPPIAPAVDWGDTYATDRFVTSAVDASILPSNTRWNYRVMAYDATGRVIGASPVRSGRLGQLDDLGDLAVSTSGDGTSLLRWEAYSGFSGCFTAYRVLAGIGAPSSVISVVSDLGTTELRTDALHPGTTYAIRVQAVRDTTLGSFVVGQSTTLFYAVPSGG